MPSRRHSSATLCSPRRPSSTIRIFSSAEILLAGCSPNVFHNPLGRWLLVHGFLSHLHSLTVTMSQKSSFLQPANSVSQVLILDSDRFPKQQVLTYCLPARRSKRASCKKCLEILAHPTRFERVTFAFGGQTTRSDVASPLLVFGSRTKGGCWQTIKPPRCRYPPIAHRPRIGA